MFAKSKISQSMIDAVNKVLGEQPVEHKEELLNETAPIKEPTPTGMRVYGGSYGNSAKAKKDQTKSPVDNLKGPKDKEMKEAAKPDFLDMDKDGNKKEPMKKAIADKSMKEELKGNQNKIDANHNDKIDGQDFEMLRVKKDIAASRIEQQAKKKVKEGREFTEKLLETVRKSDVPAYLRKAKGDTPLTMADVKAPKKDSISAPENLAKARNEWKEEVELTEEQLDEMINEVLGKDATAGDYIHDFIHSDNPKFAGKSKAERKKMALGAYYGAQKEAYEASNAPITTDTLAGRMPGGKSNSFKSFKTRVKPLAKQEGETETPDTNSAEKTSARASIKAEEVQVEATIAGTSGWEPMKKDIKDKSGAVHTPMSRAKDLARQAFKTVQNKTKVK
jgi:hypothetical protein